MDNLFPNLVIPGQVIAVATGAEDDSFLRGHGTYIEKVYNSNNSSEKIQLRASVIGIVQRVNKLISVESVSLYNYNTPSVGDLIVGRIVSIGNARWNVDIGTGSTASLPLSGVHLPGSIQRIRTAADALEMRIHLQEGDLVSAEIHKVTNITNIVLHTRSVRYGKLENGISIQVPCKLIPRMKIHYTTICNNIYQILLGCNGYIWIQRNNKTLEEQQQSSSNTNAMLAGQQELAEEEEYRRIEHANTPYTIEERQNLARLRNSILCLKYTLCEITPNSIEDVYNQSFNIINNISEMLYPENIIKLTSNNRRRQHQQE